MKCVLNCICHLSTLATLEMTSVNVALVFGRKSFTVHVISQRCSSEFHIKILSWLQLELLICLHIWDRKRERNISKLTRWEKKLINTRGSWKVWRLKCERQTSVQHAECTVCVWERTEFLTLSLSFSFFFHSFREVWDGAGGVMCYS